MKKIKIFVSISILITLSAYFCWAKYYAADFMSVKNAEKKWGLKPFSKSTFKKKDLKNRAPMAVDIIKRQLYIGKSRESVRKDLGDPDSYFFSDTIYAYRIMPFPGENKENWHLVFIPDKNLEKVKEVKIHKKCCYKSPL